MTSSGILWITTLIMAVGGLAILFTGKRRTPAEELHTVLHGIVPIIAACAYFAMACGQGEVLLPADSLGGARIFYFARYIDWTFTTPLLLVTLAMTAMHSGPKRPGIIAGVVLADLLMIVTAFCFGASETPVLKWIWFAVSCVSFLGVYYVIWVSQMEANALERADIQVAYKRNAAILSVLWLIYPVILAVAPDGLNIVSDTTSVLVIAVIDVIAKVVYGLMTVSADKSATDLDMAEGYTLSQRRVA